MSRRIECARKRVSPVDKVKKFFAMCFSTEDLRLRAVLAMLQLSRHKKIDPKWHLDCSDHGASVYD
jgi:hypothetical protein